jgi:hypothetical protein
MRHCYVPQYESLTLDKITNFLKEDHPAVLDYLPDAQEIHKISKEWICNVIATILKETFTDWLMERVNVRNEKVVEKGEMNIELDEDVAAAFRASTAVSSKFALYTTYSLLFYKSVEGTRREHAQGRC